MAVPHGAHLEGGVMNDIIERLRAEIARQEQYAKETPGLKMWHEGVADGIRYALTLLEREAVKP